ncbi:MAG: DUF2852 domain-containing protein [Pseudomonadota bacterium]
MKDRWGWLRRIEETLDRGGMPAWIATMVVGFILIWPIGLAVLGYMIWSGRMGCWKKRRSMRRSAEAVSRPSGNRAFDEYREATLKRLEEEQEAFGAFLEKLRVAKDRAEFDRFREERDAGGTRPEPAPERSTARDGETGRGFGPGGAQPA